MIIIVLLPEILGENNSYMRERLRKHVTKNRQQIIRQVCLDRRHFNTKQGFFLPVMLFIIIIIIVIVFDK